MNTYEILLFIHITAVALWLGGGSMLHIGATRAVAAADPQRSSVLGGEGSWASLRIFMPASLVVLVTGVWMVLDAGLRFEDLWITLGVAAVVVTSAVAMAVITPQAKKLGPTVAEHGPRSPQTKAITSRLLWAQRFNLTVLVVLIWVMVAKPGT